jgi:CDP-diacylglycerol---glycerol-3-phosphate 3-phosphatidyltransferase
MTNHSRQNVLFNLPNSLTLFRIVCIPLVVVCLGFEGQAASFLAALFFGAAFITDYLDGFFARKYGAVTVLGKFLDPLADKILVSVTLIMLVSMGRAPAWIVMFIVAREIAVTGLRSIVISEGIVIQASPLGKYKTGFQAASAIALCLHYEYLAIDFHLVGVTLLCVSLVLTLWSGWAYFRAFHRLFFPDPNT